MRIINDTIALCAKFPAVWRDQNGRWKSVDYYVLLKLTGSSKLLFSKNFGDIVCLEDAPGRRELSRHQFN